jgi:hypothetical protein
LRCAVISGDMESDRSRMAEGDSLPAATMLTFSIDLAPARW